MKRVYESGLLKLNLLLWCFLFFNISLSFSSTVMAEAVNLKEIQKIHYDPASAELFIENPGQLPLEMTEATHNAKRKEIVFFIPQSTLQPTPKHIEITSDPILKDIDLEQRALEGIPAVRVELGLYSNSPYLPFLLTSEPSGIKLKFSNKNETNKKSSTSAQQKTSVILTGQSVIADKQSITVDPDSSKNFSFKAYDNNKLSSDMVNSVIGPVSPEIFSVVNDIFSEESNLTVVSQKYPLAVKRSFILKEPNRYIIDLSPAVLSSRSLINRTVPVSTQGIFNVKVGQFDENTVRIVVQFTNEILPVYISQWENSRILKLSFE